MLNASGLNLQLNQAVAGIPPPTFVLDENTPVEQNFNVTQFHP
jgi:hypothetical protein